MVGDFFLPKSKEMRGDKNKIKILSISLSIMRVTEVKNVACPVCKEHKVRKSGFILMRSGRFQRYQCVNPDCKQYGFQWKGEKAVESHIGGNTNGN